MITKLAAFWMSESVEEMENMPFEQRFWCAVTPSIYFLCAVALLSGVVSVIVEPMSRRAVTWLLFVTVTVISFLLGVAMGHKNRNRVQEAERWLQENHGDRQTFSRGHVRIAMEEYRKETTSSSDALSSGKRDTLRNLSAKTCSLPKKSVNGQRRRSK